jgi:hypothetical protein
MRVRALTAVVAGTIALSLAVAVGAARSQGVDPASYSSALDQGGSVTITKTVHTPAIPPNPDIYFLTDSTGSMGDAISNVQSNAASIMSTVATAQPTAEFGAGDYKDFLSGDPYAFQNDASIGSAADALTGIGTWSADGGGDGPEAQLYALHEIANSAVGFRSDSTKIVVWFGDAPGHDPICSAASGLGSDLTTSSVASELANANVEVIAISLVTGTFYPDGLNDDSTAYEYGYDSTCGTPSPVTGEATTIANATGGLVLSNVTPDDVSNAILSGLENLPVKVDATPTCDSGLSVSLDPTSQTVTSGTDATFQETISAADDPSLQGKDLSCTVQFDLNGMSGGPDFLQTVSIHVNDTTPPTAACTPTTNPAGKKVPPAGNNPKSGNNPDGFYQVTASDNLGVDSIVIADSGSSFVSSPLSSGDKLKLTQDPTATPSQEPMSGVIAWHIITNGDPQLVVTDTSGNTTTVDCLVPPPPK